MISLFLIAFCAVSFAAAEGQQDTAAYPSSSITIIVPSKAGGGTDTMARIFAKVAQKYANDQTFVIVNKPGAGGQIGFEAIAATKNDGYTIGTIFTPHVAAHISSERANYTLDDFAPLANMVTDPGVLVVNADSPFSSVADVVAAEKAAPRSLTGSTTGAGGDDFMALTLFNREAGIEIKDVPSKGSSEQKAAVMGGHVDMAFMNFSQVEANVNSGDLRILAAMTPERLDYIPEVPTFSEEGYAITSDSSRGFVAPKDLPAEIQAKLAEIFESVMNDPEFLELAKGQLLLNHMGPEAYGAYLNSQLNTTDEMFQAYPW